MPRMTVLKKRRSEDPRGLTQEQVASELGINPTYYTEIENGKRPSLTLLLKLAKYWELPIGELIHAFEVEDSSTDAEHVNQAPATPT